MRLIYVWIENYRNIYKSGFVFDPKYEIEILDKSCDKDLFPLLSIRIKKKDTSYDWFSNTYNIENITAIVGRNGSGKSNLIFAFSELHTSFDESKFVIIYEDCEGNYILECNNVSIIDFSNNIHHARHKSFQPEVSLYKINYIENTFETIDRHGERTNELEYILVRHQTNNMTVPYANSFYSFISRFGTNFNSRGIYYKFRYFSERIGRAEDIDSDCINVNLNIDKDCRYRYRDKRIIKLIPDKFPNEKCSFDLYDNNNNIFKKAFILRLIEIKLTDTRFIDSQEVEKHIQQLNTIAFNCNFDIDEIYEQLDNILEIQCNLHKILKEKNYVNKTDTDLCYRSFLNEFKYFIEMLPNNCFKNSYEVNISVKELLKKDIREKLEKVLKLIDSVDVSLDYPRHIIDIDLENLSDGCEALSNIYATIYKCLQHNNFENYKRIVLVLDEPDLHMHPEWSRRFLFDLIKFLYHEFPTTKFHIILTTHSPYILSDLPAGHVLFLSDGKSQPNAVQTFGQNIHTLLKHSFFMDSTIGEYAKHKIDDIKDFLEKKEENLAYSGIVTLNQAEKVIESIGESILRSALLNKLKKIEANYKSPELNNLIIAYDNLSGSEKEQLIEYIIDNGQGRK